MHPGRALLLRMLLLVAASLAAPQLRAQAAVPEHERRVVDLREDVQAVTVSVADLYNRRETVTIPLTVFRPPGDGPFPLAVLAHGRWSATRADLIRARFESTARFLVGKGFAVLVPTRAGYGQTAALFDPEDAGPCEQRRYAPTAEAAADQVIAAVRHAATQPWADASRWVVIGQSVGGMAAMAVAARAPQGLLAAVNVSGGAGGDPLRRPGDPCSAQTLQRLWRGLAATSTLPVLWLYWTHDRFWGDKLPRDWAEAWRQGGGRIEFHQLGPWNNDPVDGHDGLQRDMNHALPLLDAHLARAGFTQSGLIERPPPSGHARIDEVDKLPLSATAREQALARYRAARPPKALAVSARGHYGWASGDWMMGRALGFCAAAAGQVCRLYAVDDDVVWTSADTRH